MPRFLIEVPHENKKESCDQAVRIFNQTGSHYLTNADWGCHDDVHKSWVIIDVDNKNDALMVVPPPYRDKATVVSLNKFTFDSNNQGVDQHET